jgi:hypothetical protein
VRWGSQPAATSSSVVTQKQSIAMTVLYSAYVSGEWRGKTRDLPNGREKGDSEELHFDGFAKTCLTFVK